MDAKYLLAKLRAGQLQYAEQGRAADVLLDLMKTCGIIKEDDPLWRRPPAEMPWCDRCQGYHHPTAEHTHASTDPEG